MNSNDIKSKMEKLFENPQFIKKINDLLKPEIGGQPFTKEAIQSVIKSKGIASDFLKNSNKIKDPEKRLGKFSKLEIIVHIENGSNFKDFISEGKYQFQISMCMYGTRHVTKSINSCKDPNFNEVFLSRNLVLHSQK